MLERERSVKREIEEEGRKGKREKGGRKKRGKQARYFNCGKLPQNRVKLLESSIVRTTKRFAYTLPQL